MKYKKIIIDSYKIEKIVGEFYPDKRKYDFISHISILIALITTVATVETFKDLGAWLTKVQVKAIFWIAIVIVISRLLYFAYLHYIKNKNVRKEVLKRIEESAVNISKDIYLYIFLNEFEEGNIKDTKLLFIFDKDWEVNMIPFCKKHDKIDIVKASKFLAKQLSISTEDITLESIPELDIQEEKHSVTTGELTYYTYTTFFVKHTLPSNHFIFKKSFTIGGREYKWMNINEVKQHPKTMYLNREIVLSIDNAWSNIITNY